MAKPKVLLLEGIHPLGEEALVREGAEVVAVKGALGESELIGRLKGVQVLGIRSKTQVTARVLEAAPELVAIGAYCIGTNQVALDAAVQSGVCVFNAPFSNTRSVAELVLAEVIMLSRRVGDRIMEMHSGTWRKLASDSREVRGKTLGIIGYGHIGSQVGVLAEFFGMRVLYFDVVAKLPLGNNKPESVLADLLAQADFVTLHVPETAQTRGMMGPERLGAMKRGACLLNLSRGSVVDLPALAGALKSGRLSGAAVDVFPDEPEASLAEGFATPLQRLPNVILTPHIGGSTLEAQEAIGREVSASLIGYLKAGASTASVNFPRVELAQAPETHRVVHVHRNVPGVMRDVNHVVSDHGANIHAQVLSTTSDVGYLIMDLDQPVGSSVCTAMAKLATTLKARAL